MHRLSNIKRVFFCWIFSTQAQLDIMQEAVAQSDSAEASQVAEAQAAAATAAAVAATPPPPTARKTPAPGAADAALGGAPAAAKAAAPARPTLNDMKRGEELATKWVAEIKAMDGAQVGAGRMMLE